MRACRREKIQQATGVSWDVLNIIQYSFSTLQNYKSIIKTKNLLHYLPGLEKSLLYHMKKAPLM